MVRQIFIPGFGGGKTESSARQFLIPEYGIWDSPAGNLDLWRSEDISAADSPIPWLGGDLSVACSEDISVGETRNINQIWFLYRAETVGVSDARSGFISSYVLFATRPSSRKILLAEFLLAEFVSGWEKKNQIFLPGYGIIEQSINRSWLVPEYGSWTETEP